MQHNHILPTYKVPNVSIPIPIEQIIITADTFKRWTNVTF